MYRWGYFALFLVLVFLPPTSVRADIYKYVDDDGVVVFTDSLPPHIKPDAVENSAKISHKKAAAPKSAVKIDGIAYNAGAVSSESYHHLIEKYAGKHNVDPKLLKAVIKCESNYNAGAVSRKGAMGLMQLMPATAYDLGVADPFNPDENIEAGTRYLKYLLLRFGGDLKLALAAYNAGPAPVERHKGVPPISETKNYVKKVLSLYGGKAHVPQDSRSATFYRVVLDDGTILFTNSLPPRNVTQKL